MTASSNKVYTLDDLANALLDASRYERAAEGLRTYFVPRGEAFRQAFGITEDSLMRGPKWRLRPLLNSTLRSMLSFSSPTSGYLEVTRELFVFAERFRPEIDRASSELQRVLRSMLVALLEELVPPGKTTATAEELAAHGFDVTQEAPDPVDFF